MTDYTAKAREIVKKVHHCNDATLLLPSFLHDVECIAQALTEAYASGQADRKSQIANSDMANAEPAISEDEFHTWQCDNIFLENDLGPNEASKLTFEWLRERTAHQPDSGDNWPSDVSVQYLIASIIESDRQQTRGATVQELMQQFYAKIKERMGGV